MKKLQETGDRRQETGEMHKPSFCTELIVLVTKNKGLISIKVPYHMFFILKALLLIHVLLAFGGHIDILYLHKAVDGKLRALFILKLRRTCCLHYLFTMFLPKTKNGTIVTIKHIPNHRWQ